MNSPQRFKLISETTAYENSYFRILDRHYRLPDGKAHHFYIRDEVDTCCVLAMTKESHFLCVKEFRVGREKVLVELPAGRLENANEDPDKRIRQELLEETGYTGQFKKVAELPSSPYSTRLIHVYYAVNCERITQQKLDDSEFIDLHILTKDEMYDVLTTGQSSSCPQGLLAWEWLKKDDKLY